MECCELLHENMLPLKLKRAVFKSYVRLAILHQSVTMCMKERQELWEGQINKW